MLTPSQHIALDHTRHSSVTANAGSGKTRVLVERYCALLLDGKADANAILALTFTEKAASELRRKIADRVLVLRGESADSALCRRLDLIREQLPGAFIGTLHSFCARMLREHPVEAGVDAGFRVVEGLDQQLMIREAMKEAFVLILRGEAGSAGEFRHAVRRAGKRTVMEAIKRLIGKREHLDRFVGPEGLYTEDNDLLIARWSSAIATFVESRLGDPQLVQDLKRVVTLADGRSADALRDALARSLEQTTPSSRVESLRSILDSILTEKGTLRRAAATASVEANLREETRRLAVVQKSLRGMAGILPGSDSERVHRELARLSRAIVNAAQIVIERYELRKIESALLDFDDLQLKTKALLRREPVREYLAGRFKYVMVDEYQDTNELQYEILRPLLTDLTTGNLFIVGDPKQSIYGFRNADIAVFERTRADILSVAGSGVVLEESFRLLRDLAAFVNTCFRPIMQRPADVMTEDGESEEVAYQPLVVARANADPGAVEILLDDPDLGETYDPEGDRIARRIAWLVESGSRVFDQEEIARPVAFGDIAVLLRSRTFLPGIESAFVKLGIPYMVSGGTGYFQTQDVLDYCNYLQFLLDPDDDIALTGILRSPFFAVSDVELFEIIPPGRGGALWDYLSGADNLPRTIAYAVHVLREDRDRCARMPISEIIAHLSHVRLYGAKSAGTRRGPQTTANIEKLQKMAREYEEQGFTTTYDFVRRLKRLIEEEGEEGQGIIESQTDAVQIMTVHAAKGLEFPVVVIPHLHRSFRSDSTPIIDRRTGLAFEFRDDSGQGIEPEILRLARERSARRSEAEEKRILYVACTRARDRLILSGDPARGRGASSWMRWIQEALGWQEGEVIPRDWVLRTSTVMLQSGDGVFTRRTEEHDLRVSVIKVGVPERGPSTPGRVVGEAPPPEFRVAPLAGVRKGEVFSATRIKTYRECPSLYYLRYVLGLRIGSFPPIRPLPEETEDREHPGELRGRLFHSVMQRIDVLGPDREALRREVIRNLGTEWTEREGQDAALVQEILNDVERVLDSALWQEVGSGTDARTEYTISCVLGEDTLSGTMDRIYRDRAGVWHVLDYKTDRVDANSFPVRADSYWPQLMFYALLVHRFFSAPRVSATLLFTSAVDRPVRRIFHSKDLASIEEDIQATISSIRSGDFTARRPPCPDCPMGPTGCPTVSR